MACTDLLVCSRSVGARDGMVSRTHWNIRPHIRHMVKTRKRMIVKQRSEEDSALSHSGSVAVIKGVSKGL